MYEDLMEEIKVKAKECKSWADFANFIFSSRGILHKKITSDDERMEFMTLHKEEMRTLYNQCVERTGWIEGAKATETTQIEN